MEAKDLLEKLKSYDKIEYDTDDEVLLLVLEAAMETLHRVGVPENEGSALYKLAVLRLALHYYEHREEITTVTQTVPMGMNWMIEHLRYGGGEE